MAHTLALPLQRNSLPGRCEWRGILYMSSVKNSLALITVQARIHVLLTLHPSFQHSLSIGFLNFTLFGTPAKLQW